MPSDDIHRPIIVQCRRCGQNLSAPASASGRQGRCPRCASPIDIPATGIPQPSIVPGGSSAHVNTQDDFQGSNAELARLQSEITKAKIDFQRFLIESRKQREQLAQEYEKGRATYEELKKEVGLLEENLEDISYGLYKPHFDFQTSEAYKVALDALRDKERMLIRNDQAAKCSVQWTVGGSKQDGARMAKQNKKLVLRAFNGECDAALANVSWSNILKMEERIQKSAESLNNLGGVLQVSIAQGYLDLKIKELRLAYEYEEKRHQEREEQRRIREEMREEEKARKEWEEAKEAAAREMEQSQKALDQARAEVSRATGAQLEKMNETIKAFESQLAESQVRNERAISMAQLTKAGNVYVISNVGSFGENVFKVGLTRRVDPQERIDELGDASVPFPFDVHAIIPSKNAPELELALHNYLDARKINLINPRKEFFRVSLDEIEAFVKKKGLTIEFTKVAEAREYRETMSVRQQPIAQQRPMPRPQSKPEQATVEFPVNPFLSNPGK